MKTHPFTLNALTPRALVASASLLCAAHSAHAIDIDAGDYTALPEGTSVAAVYAQHATRDALYASGKQVDGRYGLDSNIGILRLIHFTKVAGYTVDPQVLLPFGRLQGKENLSALGSASGLGDAIFAATVWTVNDPARHRYLGITPFVYVPTGSYDASKPLNLGENRWRYALQAAYIQAVTDTVKVDVAADVTLYGDNTHANTAGQTKTQSASYQLQAFVRHNISSGWDVRAGLSRAYSGEVKLDGQRQFSNALVDKWQVGTGYFVSPRTQLLASYGQDLRVSAGLKENARLNLRLLQVF